MTFQLTDIPQADRLDKVIFTVKAVMEGANTDVKIAAAIGFSDRQGRYYRHAAEILGFIINERNNATITKLGEKLNNVDSTKKLNIIRNAVYNNSFFKSIVNFLNERKNIINEDQLRQFVQSITNTQEHSTIPRRLKTILSWLSYLDIIIENEDGYQINQKTYLQTEEPVEQISSVFAEYLYSAGNKTLQEIEVSNISPNPHNPRLIFDPEELNELKGSISKVGILVPLTVYRNSKSFPKTEYVLLDGERRWRCAKELGLKVVPANVIDEPKDITQNILFMFNIHHFRKEWALFPTALKLEVIIEKLGTDQEAVLSEFTGVSRGTIRRCKALLWYPTKYRDTLLEKSGKISTDFFIELFPIAHPLSHEDEFLYPQGIERFVDACIAKFESQNFIHDVKEFREMRKAMGYYENINNFSEFIDRIEQFISEKIGLEIFASIDIEEERTFKNIVKYISYLNANLVEVNSDILSDLYIEDQLRSLSAKLIALLESLE
jgi:ParB family chromosome partitioning protein